MSIILELLRIVLIFSILGSITQYLLNEVYLSLGIYSNTVGSTIAILGIFTLLFVLYRNKLQFFGFYQGPNQVKLPKYLSVALICFSIILFIIAPLI